MALIGAVDYLTGLDASVAYFYLVPIVVVSWYGKGSWGYAYSLLGALIWGYVQVFGGQHFDHSWILLWNTALRLFSYWTVVYLLCRVQTLLLREQELSRRDSVTGLWNRRAFFEILEAEVARCQRKRRTLALAFIDLDHFKTVNDQLGHAEGDRVLVQVARVFTEKLRRSDILARLGGDEFAVLLPECPLKDSATVAAKLVASLGDLAQKQRWPVGASIGMIFVQAPDSQGDLGAIVAAADRLMYRVKDQGRNSYLVETYSGPNEASIAAT